MIRGKLWTSNVHGFRGLSVDTGGTPFEKLPLVKDLEPVSEEVWLYNQCSCHAYKCPLSLYRLTMA